MADNMSNIREFKDACVDFGINFRDTDDRQRKEMLIHYKVNNKSIINDRMPIDFVHSVNWCKIDIGNFESLNIHCEISTEWQDFKYNRHDKILLLSGRSGKYGHNYTLEVALPQKLKSK